MTKIKSCLLCENYNTHPCKCAHCEDWDNFSISESGKALKEKIYGDGYQDGHRDGYDKGYDDAQANYERPQGEWIEKVERRGCFAGDKTVYSYTCPFCGVKEFKKYPFCHCGADMRGDNNAPTVVINKDFYKTDKSNPINRSDLFQ